MPRSTRIILPHTPHHIVQRGCNRQVVFVSDDDYNCYLENLVEFKRKFESRIYASCLMINHVHPLIDPGKYIRSLGLLMKGVAGRQTRYANKLEKRFGSLWEGRYKWSSYGAKVAGTRGSVVDSPLLFSLGDTEQERQKTYEAYVSDTVPEFEIKLICEALQRGQLAGGDRFRVEIEKKLGCRISNK